MNWLDRLFETLLRDAFPEIEPYRFYDGSRDGTVEEPKPVDQEGT